MSAGMDKTLADNVLNAILRAQAAVNITDGFKLALFTGDPSNGGVECSGGGYARTACAWKRLAANDYRNNGAITFPNPTGVYTAEWWILYTDARSPVRVFAAPFLAPLTTEDGGDPVVIPDGALTISFQTV